MEKNTGTPQNETLQAFNKCLLEAQADCLALSQLVALLVSQCNQPQELIRAFGNMCEMMNAHARSTNPEFADILSTRLAVHLKGIANMAGASASVHTDKT